jgi:UDP-glucose 4-epimerase
MNIVVTGGSGFIGSNLYKRLFEDGNNVSIVDIEKNGPVQIIKKIVKFRPDIIYHLAAQSRVQPSFEDPAGCFDDNVVGTQAVLEFARQKKCKVVYAGSSSKHHDPYDSPYAATKMIGEELCKMYKSCYDLDVEIARFYNVYGPGEELDPKNGNVIGIWRWCVATNNKAKIVGDGEQRRDFIHVSDIVDGLIKIGESDKHHEDAWELGTGKNYSINELAEMFKRKFQLEFDYVEDQRGNYRETLNTNTDGQRQLGWFPNDRLKSYINSL